jgi:hypothetical protein
VSGIYHYAAYYRINGGLWQQIARNQPNLSIPVALSKDSVYEFVSLAIDSAGNREDWPAAPDFAWPVNLSVKEIVKPSIHIYPNPATNQLNVVSDAENALTSITLTDMQGRVVLTTTANGTNQILFIGHLPNGLYNVKVDTEKKSFYSSVFQKL